MTQEHRVGGVLLDPDRVLLTGGSQGGVAGLPSAAFYGEPGRAGVQIDDPFGDLDLLGWQTYTVDETACVGKTRMFTGWLFGRVIDRGTHSTGPARVWDCDILDQNEVFSFKAFRASSAKRPAETDIARVAFLIDSAPMAANPAHDNGLANITDNPVSFGPSDYVTQYPVELMMSVAGTSGKNFYAYWDHAAEEISLYYDQTSAVVRESTLRISNVMSDVDGTTTFYPFKDARLERAADGLHSGALLGWRGGYVYGQRQDTIDTYSSPGSPFERDLVYRTDRIGRLDTANAVLAQMLADHAIEADTITCTVRLPASQVNLIEAGEWVDVRFSHLPGYEAFTQLPVVRRNVVPVAGRRDRYDLQLEFSTRTPGRGPGGGSPGGFPWQAAAATVRQFKAQAYDDEPLSTIAFDSPTIPGSALGMISWHRSATAWVSGPSGWTQGTFTPDSDDDMGGGFHWKEADGTEAAISVPNTNGDRCVVIIAELVGVATAPSVIGAAAEGTGNPVDTGSVAATGAGIAIGGAVVHTSDGGGHSMTPGSGWTEIGDLEAGSGSTFSPLGWAAYRVLTAAASVSATGTCSQATRPWGGRTMFWPAATMPPSAGQPVPETPTPTQPDGTEDTFDTLFPFADGSLRVFHDGINQTQHVIDQDADVGNFQLGYQPSAGSSLTHDFQGR